MLLYKQCMSSIQADLNLTGDSKDNSLLEVVQAPNTGDDSFRLTTGALLEFENQRNQMILTLATQESEIKVLRQDNECLRLEKTSLQFTI